LYKIKVTKAVLDVYGHTIDAEYTTATGFVTEPPPAACSNSVVISQVFGGGGQVGALFTNDFVELHNNGEASVDLTNWSLQYASALGTSWSNKVTLSGQIAPGGYFLVQLSTAGTAGSALPTPDQVGNISMGAANGKVTLITDTGSMALACPSSPYLLDWVGYGTTTVCSQTAVPVLSVSTAALRKNGGCTDTNQADADFTVEAPNPRNSASPRQLCSCSGLNPANENGINEINWCILQYPSSFNVLASQQSVSVFGRVYQASITPDPAVNPPVLKAQVGYGPASVNPTTQSGWIWTNAGYNTGFIDLDNDEFFGTITAPATTGSYRYAFRFSPDGLNWTYCDSDGSGSNVFLEFDLDKLGVMTVQ